MQKARDLERIVVFACVLLVATPFCAGGCGARSPSLASPTTSPTSPTTAPASPLPLTITAADAVSLVQGNKTNPDFVILDVRTAAEFATGHIEGAINIDYYSADFRARIGAQNSGKRYLVYCRTGVRGAAATQVMTEAGFTRVQNLAGGLDEWVQEGYPTVT